jgi:hypothetical protein
METAASFEARFAPWSYPAHLPPTVTEISPARRSNRNVCSSAVLHAVR